MGLNLILSQVKSIINLYKKHAELSGENFNIFSIMGMESDEVRTHSSIIGELLNPNGNHSLGSKPLEIFINQVFKEHTDFELDYVSSNCKKEFHVGKITEDKLEGGRIDIILEDKSGCKVVIENKIYAPEQVNQLKRYQMAYPNAKIVFLTLEGQESKFQGELNYEIISYKNDILNWIEACAKEAFDKPMVREVLNQYAYLIRKLTNQSKNEEMSNEISQVIKENYLESLEIFRNLERVRNEIVSEAFEKILSQISIQYKNEWEISFDIHSIWSQNTSKVILVSIDSNSEDFFYLRYEYSSSKLFVGGVPKVISSKKGKRSIHREEVNFFKNDFVVEYQMRDSPQKEQLSTEVGQFFINYIKKFFVK